MLFIFFFFSSRRRHTRSLRDWSSDVCSSDLGPRLTDSALLLQVAADGQGVALARRRLAAGWVESGRLVQPFGPAVPLGPAYWLVLPARGTPIRRAAQAFAAWIRSEGRRESR